MGTLALAVPWWPEALPGYPAYAGYDKDMQAVAVLVDLRMLDDAT